MYVSSIVGLLILFLLNLDTKKKHSALVKHASRLGKKQNYYLQSRATNMLKNRKVQWYTCYILVSPSESPSPIFCYVFVLLYTLCMLMDEKMEKTCLH